MKDLIRAKHDKNVELINNINGGLIDLRSAIIIKEIPESESPRKMSTLLKKTSTLINNKQVKELKY